MTGIYKYQNKINGKIYIGQSVNIEKRYQQHLYDSQHLDTRRCAGIDYAIIKYGINNFTFEIIEQCSLEQLDEREKYWIDYYDSYNNGYNRTIGGMALKGENHPRAILTEEQVWQIRELYNQRVTRTKVYKQYADTGITMRGFLKIWNGETWQTVHMDVYTSENKAWHKKQVGHSEDQLSLSSQDRAITQEEINLWIQEYNSGSSIYHICQKYHRDHGTVEKYIYNPVAVKKVKYKGRKIQNVETKIIFSSISSAAKWAKCGATTLTRHLTTDKIAGVIPEMNIPAHWIELT